MNKGARYWSKAVSEDALVLHRAFQRTDNGVKETTMAALLAALSAVFQSAGGFLPGIGFLISPFAAAPIQLGMVYSFRCGLLSYGVAIVVLMVIQPSELVIFPFTTGVLGIVSGLGLIRLRNKVAIILAGAAGLCTGIVILLYVLHVPVLGPAVSVSFQAAQLGIIALFSCAYSWLWLELSLAALRKIRNMLEV